MPERKIVPAEEFLNRRERANRKETVPINSPKTLSFYEFLGVLLAALVFTGVAYFIVSSFFNGLNR